MDPETLPTLLAAADPRPAAAAALVLDAFEDYNARFSDITRRARRHFERRDWRQSMADMRARISLYDECIRETQGRLDSLLDDGIRSRALWSSMRLEYAARLNDKLDAELYKTWFSTLSRRNFHTRGVDEMVEYVAMEREPVDAATPLPPLRSYVMQRDRVSVFLALLQEFRPGCGYVDMDAAARQLAVVFAQRMNESGTAVLQLDMLTAVFYRDRRAYLVGRQVSLEGAAPIVIVLAQSADGVRVDALLTETADISALFDYSHSYFHADIAPVGSVVAFMHVLLPRKPLEELYTVLGRAKQGKTERYRRLFLHFRSHPDDRLVHAEGKRGMVMLVMTPIQLPVVIKLIRDRFVWPKDLKRRDVEEKYRLVMLHDRVGRLVDAQEFRQLRIGRQFFAPEMLAELMEECGATVSEDGDDIVISHCYIQRRLRPLDLYLREVGPEAARSAVLDYGQAIKDLAGSRLFPGDMLLKNFGVSRAGRAIFYDYDEVCGLDDCHFRALPAARPGEEMLALEDRVYAAPGDVFPEMFAHFMGVGAELRACLREAHHELFEPAWWQALQARLRTGEYVDVPPYPARTRLS
ncbi:bifunctional isocitrate dehydrogenase kinase/phosphatase [Frateuria aurantia]